MCIHCNHEVNWQKSSTLSSHVLSLHHLSIKNGGKKTLPTTIQSCLSTQDKKQEFNSDFVEMMLACNIPLEKRDKMENWLQKYLPNAGWIPSSDALRKVYVPKVISKHKLEITNKIQNQPLSLIIDGSPDRLSRNVVNSIIHCGYSGDTFLLGTTFLNEINNISLFNLIDNVRQEYSIKWKNIETLVCDSASYNKKLYNTIKSGINPNIKLMRCWAHQLDLVSDVW